MRTDMTDPRIETVARAIAEAAHWDWDDLPQHMKDGFASCARAALAAADSGQEPVAYLVVSDCGKSHVEKLHLKKSDAERDAENFNAFGHAERTKIHPLYASPPLPSREAVASLLSQNLPDRSPAECLLLTSRILALFGPRP